MKIYVVNGPNLNFLGIREKEIYGTKTYEDLVNYLLNYASENNIEIYIKQTNSEGEFIDYLQEAYFEKADGIVVNPGAYSHYSYAIYDAIKSLNIKTIEVHLSDVLNREDFRKNLVTSEACDKTISGKGFDSYIEALKCFNE